MAPLIIAAARSVDVGQPHQDALDVPAARVEGKTQLAFDVYAHGLGHVEISCLYLDLHSYLRANVALGHDRQGNGD
jgi:hypothetical protein